MIQKTIIASLLILVYGLELHHYEFITMPQMAAIGIVCFSFLAITNTLFLESLMRGPKYLGAKVLAIAGLYLVFCSLLSPLSIPLLVGMAANLYYMLVVGMQIIPVQQTQPPFIESIKTMFATVASKGRTMDSIDGFENLKSDTEDMELLGVTKMFIRNFEDIYTSYTKEGLPKQSAIEIFKGFNSDIQDILSIAANDTTYTDDREVYQRLVSISNQTIKELK